MSAVEVESVITGKAGAPAVVLSNSLGSTYWMWDAQLATLEERFQVIRYNSRGHGESPVPTGPYSIDDLTDDVVAVLDRYGIGRAHVVGLSLGGMTGIRLAARNPERVDRLALLCTAAHLPPEQAWRDRAATVRSTGADAVSAAVIDRWFTAAFLDAHPATRRAFQAMIDATPAEGYAGCCEAIAGMDVRGDLGAITAPTLVIAGADDPATPPAMLADIAAGIADAELMVVEHAAHLANIERADVITPALIAHLETTTGLETQ